MPDIKPGSLYLGSYLDPATAKPTDEAFLYEARDFTTHGVIVGMTGSGKTGLGVVLLEEALLAGVPVLALDPKGDLTNLLLNFPDFRASDFAPWVNPGDAQRAGLTVAEYAAQQAATWQQGLAAAGVPPERMRALRDGSQMTIYTPGSTAGVPMNIVGSLQCPPVDWATGAEGVRDEIEGFVSSLLVLAGIAADPITSREHILLSNLIEHAWSQGQDLDVARLLAQVQKPPLRKLGVFDLETFYPEKERQALAMRLNGLFAAPSFGAWMSGPPLDVAAMLGRPGNKPNCSIVYLAHLSEEERQFIVPLVLSKVVTWFRSQAGTTDLQALVYMDEVYGFAPPSANPPSKKPILTIFKQARAFGVGMVVATQNPVDLDYKAISNAGTWMIGRLQTEQDKARLMDGLKAVSGTVDPGALGNQISGLGKRQFLLQKAGGGPPRRFTSRWAMSYLRGPLTKEQIGTLMKQAPERQAGAGAAAWPGVAAAPVTGARAAGDVAADETPLAPTVAPGIPVYYLDPAAPWAREVGASATGRRLAAALVARVNLHYDDTAAEIDHQEEWEAVYYPPAERFDPADLRAVDYDARDFERQAPAGYVYGLPAAPIDKAAYFKAAQTALREHLVRSQKLVVPRNKALKLYGRPGEAPEVFSQRCAAAAEDAADAEVAKIRDRLEGQLERLKDAVQAQALKAQQYQAEQAAKQQDVWVGTAGSVLGSLFGGRRRSGGLASVAKGMGTFSSRQSRAAQAGAKAEAAKHAVADKEQEVAELEEKIAQEVQEIHDRWMERAAAIDTVTIAAERTDIEVAEIAVVWVPV